MPREKVTFPPNIPAQVILDGKGELQPSTDGSPEYRYFLAQNRIMWVPEIVHAQIQRAQAKDGDLLQIEKRKTSKAAATWTVELIQDEPNYGYGTASPTSAPPPAPSPRSAPRPQPTPAPFTLWKYGEPATDQPQTHVPIAGAMHPPAAALAEAPINSTDKLSAALCAAIDAAADSITYANRKYGILIEWTASDIRAMAATIFIDARKEGR